MQQHCPCGGESAVWSTGATGTRAPRGPACGITAVSAEEIPLATGLRVPGEEECGSGNASQDAKVTDCVRCGEAKWGSGNVEGKERFGKLSEFTELRV